MAERWTPETEELVSRALLADGRRALEALAEAGLLLPPGGDTQERWRHTYLDSGGSITTATREAAEGWHQRYCVNRGPEDPPQGPCVTQVSPTTTWPDGRTLAGPWVEVTPDA